MKVGTLLLLGAGLFVVTRKPKPAPKKPTRVPIGGWTAAPPHPATAATPTPTRTTPPGPSRTNP